MSKKHSKRALMTSVLALVLCVAMLAGATFAWFTDQATTSLNTIESGTLDVELQYENGDKVGSTIDFVKHAESTATTILWEPNANYKLPAIKVVNNGTLALKYKLMINGTTGTGEAKLAKVLDVIVDGVTVGTLADLMANAGTDTQKTLTFGRLPATGNNGSESQAINISLQMQKDAGNEYQGLTVTGLKIDVVAGQDTVEYDSFNNTYDATAPYGSASSVFTPAQPSVEGAEMKQEADATDYTYSENGVQASVPADAVAGDATPTVTVKPSTEDAPAGVVIEAGDATMAYEVKIENVTLGNGNLATVSFPVPAGLQAGEFELYHNGTKMNEVSGSGTPAADTYTYDLAGSVTIWVDNFSVFTFVYPEAAVPAVTIGNNAYATLDAAVNAAQAGDTIVLHQDLSGDGIVIKKKLTIDLNGNTYTVNRNLAGSPGTKSQAFQLLKGSEAVTFKNGTLNCTTESGAQLIIMNYCDLTLDNVIVDGSNLSGDKYTMSNNNGTSVFQNGTKIIAAANGVAFDIDHRGDSTYPSVKVTIDNATVLGNIIVDSRKEGTDLATLFEVKSGSFTDIKTALEYAADDATITLAEDAVIADTIMSKADNVTLNMNGKTISNTTAIWKDANTSEPNSEDHWSLISVRAGSLTITGNGTFDALENDCYAADVKNGTLTIKNGTFVGNWSTIYVTAGNLFVEGGSYNLKQLNSAGNYQHLLNCKDANYENDTATITVTGGTFYGFNPADNAAEGENTNFVATGKTVTQSGDWYTVA